MIIIESILHKINSFSEVFTTMKKDIKDTIIKSSYALLLKRGIREISVQDIVKLADISTRTFYRYFESKEAVINHIITTGLKRNKSNLKMVKSEYKNPIDAYVKLISITFLGVKAMSTQFYIDLIKYYPDQFKLMSDFIYNDVINFYINNYKQGRKIGLYRPELNPKFSAMLRVETVFNSLYKLFLTAKDFSKEFVYFGNP